MAPVVRTTTTGWQARIDSFLAHRPDVALMAPMMVYLALLGVRDLLPPEHGVWAALLRGVGGLLAVWVVRRHLPPWGAPHWRIAIPAGILVAIGWVVGQHFFNSLGVPVRLPLPLFGEAGPPVDPRDVLGSEKLYWWSVVTRIAVAVITVPIVEEIFWRAFLLRALVSWADFERVPLGRFTWFSFLGTSLLSTVQHPDNWLVSIFCWMAFNALFYWRPSVLFLVIVHGVTNLALYVYVVEAGDWMFW